MSAALPIRHVEKIWGREALPPPFEVAAGKRIGEIWFQPPGALDELLVKYIFTSQKLSIQAHPSDAQTLSGGMGRQGKDECWLVIESEPGAVLGVGFAKAIGPDQMREAALNGLIEDLLEWHAVAPGDFFYIPANTVHAIGAGVSLIEVQQNSDITYRLYDYGRPRELHLDAGLAVAAGTPYDGSLRRNVPGGQSLRLVDGPFFRLDQITGTAARDALAAYGDRPVLVIPRIGTVMVGDESIPAPACALASSVHALFVQPGATCLVAQPCQ